MPILPTRATLLTTPIGSLRDWGLIISCPCRGFPRHLAVDQLAKDFGTRPSLESILAKLRCAECRRVPSRVMAKRGDPFATRVTPVMLLETKGAVDRNRG